MSKQASNTTITLAFIWIPVAFFIANGLNQIETSTETHITVPICHQTSNNAPLLVAKSAEPCYADRMSYGMPFTFKKVYTLEKPITDPVTRQTTSMLTRYMGLGGEEITLIDSSVRAYGRVLVGWNYVLLLITPLIAYGAISLYKKND